MGYRGEDLDLRTPQTWTAVTPDALGGAALEPQRVRPILQQGVGRTGPIWVDDVVLACSNHAFDVALAHRSSEVRLEHLLHALTRVDLAADVLEAYGLRVGQLRRDSATVIASEIPVGLGNGRAAPRRSDELEDVLRMAAGLAARRNAPASVEDLLHVMLETMPELPGLQLFQRNLGARPINTYAEVMPPMARNPYTYDPMEQSRERLRSSYVPAEQIVRPAARSDFNAAPVDSVQNTRLDALEQMVRTLGLDLQNERKLVATVLQDVQRESGVPRDDAGQPSSRHDERQHTPPADLAPQFDRLMAMERTLQAVLLANQRTSELLTEKIASLGTRSGGVDLTPIINRLDIIEEAVLSRDGDPHASLSERLDALDEQLTAERLRSTEAQSALLAELSTVKGQLERQRGEIAVAILTPLTDRVNGLSAAIEGRDEDVARDFTTVKERLAGVEKGFAAAAEKTNEVVQAATTRAAEAQKTHTLELGEVHEALMKLNANQHTLAGSVEQWRRDGSTALGGLGDRILSLTTNLDGIGTRLQGVEKEAGRPMQMLEAMSGTMDNMHKVTVERYYRRNRFWYWLFGTDDWVASSWPSHAQRIAEDLKSVKAVARAKA